MSKKSRFRRTFDKQHGKRAQELLKSASKRIYQISGRHVNEIEFEKISLLTCQILGLLVNTLAADEKYPVLNRDNLTIELKCNYLKTKRFFSIFG